MVDNDDEIGKIRSEKRKQNDEEINEEGIGEGSKGIYEGANDEGSSSSAKKIKTQELIGRKSRPNRRFLALDAYSKHKLLVNEYLLTHPGSTANFKRDTRNDKTEYELLMENHQFLWDEDDQADTWAKRLAKKYYDKLFKEYCICDLSRYKENKVAMRWRTEQELVDGKGQFICGDKRCQEKDGLRSWEVNFSYIEHDVKKNALVKLRLCDDCSYKLNYHHKKKEVKKKKHKKHENESQETSSKDDNQSNERPSNVNNQRETNDFDNYLSDLFM